jgi:iron complex transport system ATP-binding protein
MNLKKIGYRYENRWALKGIDLDLKAGEILGILGPNGSGKSTLLKIMDNILMPQEGEINIRSKPFHIFTRAAFAKEVAMVAQENHFRFSFSALEVVLMGRFPHLKRLEFEGQRDIEIARGALRLTHALDLSGRSIHELSEGEKQRVFIARALAQEPKIILLDEPTSFLDLKFKKEIFRLISNLNKDKGLSVVLVSHDIDLAAHYCHRLIMLKNGTIYAAGAPDKVITSSNIEYVYECPVLVDNHPLSGRPRINLV